MRSNARLSPVVVLLLALAGGDVAAQVAESSTRPGYCRIHGVATVYHEGLHGLKTASGEQYDRQAMTAAHRTLPIGTKVLVTNLRNLKQVVVRINDRGPFVDGRVIDLSSAAAAKLGMDKPGKLNVQLSLDHDAMKIAERPAPDRVKAADRLAHFGRDARAAARAAGEPSVAERLLAGARRGPALARAGGDGSAGETQ